MKVLAMTIGQVISPLTLIDIAVSMMEGTLPMGSTHDPIAFIVSIVRPILPAVTIPEPADPLT